LTAIRWLLRRGDMCVVDGGVPALHNGGLRVIILPDQLTVPVANSSCFPETVIHDADELKAGDRLMIGIAANPRVLTSCTRTPNSQ
jgi:hypothetical protein